MHRMMSRFKELSLAVGFSVFVVTPVVQAQGRTCSADAPPCLDQPTDDKTEITGRLTAPGVASVAGTVVHIKVNNYDLGIAGKLDTSTGAFTFALPSHLSQYDTVEVFQFAPPPAAGMQAPTTNSVRVRAAATQGSTCDGPKKPCLDQPHEGDAKVTGSLEPNPPSGAVVTIKINDALVDGMSGQIVKGKFTFSDLHPLSQYDTVEVIQSSPPTAGGAPQPTTGKVTVKAALASTNLKLTIPATSLSFDFGHQAMQTKSAVKTVTITNSSTNDVDIEDPSTTVTSPNYIISSNSCVGTIAKKASCSFGIAFAPFSSGPHPGSAERDFVVIVPGTPEARRKYTTLLAELQQSRNSQRVALRNAEEAMRLETKSEQQVRLTKTAAGVGPAAGDKVSELNGKYDSELQKANTAIQDMEQGFQVISLTGIPDHWAYPLTRAVVGIDLSAPSAQAIKQAYYLDFDLLAPLKLPGLFEKNEDPIENRLWLWFNPRITSLPQAANFSALSTINETGSFFNQESSKGTLGDIQGLDVNGGFEIAIVKPRDGIPWWAEYANTQARLSPSLLVGAGMSTPFSTNNTDVVSQVNQSICDAFNVNVPPKNPPLKVSNSAGLFCQPGVPPSTSPVIIAPDGSSKSYIDFFTPERSRFFRKAYVGFRLKTYFFSRTIKADCNPPSSRGDSGGDCDGLYNIFPGTLDLTFGKDEAVTGGHMSTWLFRLEANYPLPFYQGIHIFASMYTTLSGNALTQPYNSYTINTPTTGANNDANTFRFGLQPLNRDYFRVGVGLDLVQLFKKTSSGGQPNSQAPTPQSTVPPGATP
jgi:hypothetical protein